MKQLLLRERKGWTMQPRGRLDIGWSDLLFALRHHADGASEQIEQRIERFWSPGQTLVSLSVRTGFDALLQALAMPPGSEMLVSAITIRDMTRIIEAHGLVPVPVDLDMNSLRIDASSMRNAITPRTRGILVAHIFGSRMPLDQVIAVARDHNLIVFEDFAQAYARSEDRGDPHADISMFSFGPIKTNTALAGAILTVRDSDLLARTKAIVADYPRQSARSFRGRIRKYMGIKLISHPIPFGMLAVGCRLTGRTHDRVISHTLRGFPGPDLLRRIRMLPSAPLLALLERRITTFEVRRIERREKIARLALSLIPAIEHPGNAACFHTHWVVPICVDEPDELMRKLWRAGFDATRGASSLAVVDPPSNRPETEPVEARRAMSRLLYLPISPGMRRRDMERLTAIVNAWRSTLQGPAPAANSPRPADT